MGPVIRRPGLREQFFTSGSAGTLLVDVAAIALVRVEDQPGSIRRPGRVHGSCIEREPGVDTASLQQPDVAFSGLIHLIHCHALRIRRESQTAEVISGLAQGSKRLASTIEPRQLRGDAGGAGAVTQHAIG